ncbi:hypothetical protein [Kocuria arenosa]|uniref:hypothetical protein n=1 Tax=Kocuria arenosa TaxID=3071446 RepID=UPI0034D7B0D2
MAITSGVAATGWLLLGATGAQAAEEPATLITSPSVATISTGLAPLTDTVDDIVDATPVVDEVLPGATITNTTRGAVHNPVAAGKDPIATVGTITTPATGTVDQLLGATPVAGEIMAPGTTTTVTESALAVVRNPLSVITNPVGAVETITTPVTDTLSPVTEVLSPVTGTVEDILGPAPVTGGIEPPTLEGPGLTPVAPAPVPPVAVPPEAEVTTLTPAPSPAQAPAGTSSPHGTPASARPDLSPGASADPVSSTPASAPTRPSTDSAAGTTSTPSTSATRVHRPTGISFTGPGWNQQPAQSTGLAGAAPGAAGPSSTSGSTPAPTGNGSASGGGSGSPLGSADPAGWPGMPDGTCYLELFPRLIAGEEKSFFDPVENPPTAPVFDPGSTPD